MLGCEDHDPIPTKLPVGQAATAPDCAAPCPPALTPKRDELGCGPAAAAHLTAPNPTRRRSARPKKSASTGRTQPNPQVARPQHR
ncbi:hypothetical protein BDA96_02G232700 [Sorghum bicolor]|uniref:Uncharacterized protein n=1 Tax=Sorghum bicolor TaxID=4558 RepID=A0A921RRA3_SORBI|nr:hypothetical protein BDA96_02G232700 [Sorghum bicolor]